MKIKFLVLAMVVALPINAFAQVDAFADTTTVVHYTGNTETEKFPTGKFPFIGRLGIEYKNITFPLAFQLGYIHRSNWDISSYEYSYNGVFVGVKYNKCIYSCSK